MVGGSRSPIGKVGSNVGTVAQRFGAALLLALVATGFAPAAWADAGGVVGDPHGEVVSEVPTRGRLQGVVTASPVGIGVPNANVTLRSTTLPWSASRTTDRDGGFEFLDVPAGIYALEADAAGLSRAEVSPILVVPGILVMESVVLVDPTVPRPPLLRPRS